MALFRVDYSGRGELADRQQHLAQMMSRLQKISEEYNVAVFITNQMTADPGATLSFQVRAFIIQARVKINVPLFTFPVLAAAWQTDQPLHSQSAKMENLQIEFIQLSSLILLDLLFWAFTIRQRGPVTRYLCHAVGGSHHHHHQAGQAGKVLQFPGDQSTPSAWLA